MVSHDNAHLVARAYSLDVQRVRSSLVGRLWKGGWHGGRYPWRRDDVSHASPAKQEPAGDAKQPKMTVGWKAAIAERDGHIAELEAQFGSD